MEAVRSFAPALRWRPYSSAVEVVSIEQNRRRKKIKTDSINAQKMVRMLCRWHGGERGVFRTLCVPSEEDEDRRHLHRELKTIKGDRDRVINRMRALLTELGLNSRVSLNARFPGCSRGSRCGMESPCHPTPSRGCSNNSYDFRIWKQKSLRSKKSAVIASVEKILRRPARCESYSA